MAKNDGGAAFPRDGVVRWPDSCGMSLRDWFAGQALAGGETRTASHCYLIADSMLAERDKAK